MDPVTINGQRYILVPEAGCMGCAFNSSPTCGHAYTIKRCYEPDPNTGLTHAWKLYDLRMAIKLVREQIDPHQGEKS